MTPWRIGFVPFLFCLLGLSLVPLVSSRSQESRDTVYQLSPITVTSPRTPEALLEVPLAVSLIPQRVFQHTRLLGLNEALALTPGVLAQSRAGGLDMRLTIRGFGARGNGDRSNAGTIRGIRVLLDGFPLSEPDGRTSLDLVDLWSAGSLEVIRSNATALYGGASGGLIQVNSATNGEEPFVSAGAILGSFGLTSQMVQAGLPLGAGKLFLSAGNMNFSGWRDHSSGTRAILHAVATAPLGDQSRVSVHLSGTSNLFKIPGPLTLEQYDANPQQADSTYLARDERRSNKLARLGVKLDHTLSEHQSISFIAFVEPKVLQ